MFSTGVHMWVRQTPFYLTVETILEKGKETITHVGKAAL